jgi:lipopolysaccharide transport system ATP-binding protein
MEKIVIKVQNLGKKYTIGTPKDGSLRGSLMNLFKRSSEKGEDFWALKELNFEISKGDIVGVIGRNGAGKSTLLKVLSKITKPTKGRIEINGRVASLLEVGTGFHPELTGRENIYLNGTILGMTRKEVTNKFDEIVEFSGVRKFIDTPVKRYSSGQYVRLAFAVAAHLDPEILIIDEVLAVGDSEFQKKCLGKMQDVAKQGRTVLFVSHNMNAIGSLCTSAILLRNGALYKKGPTREIINHYLTNDMSATSSYEWDKENAPGDDEAKLISARLIDKNYQNIVSFDIAERIGVEFKYEVLKCANPKIPNIHLYTNKGDHVLYSAENEDLKLLLKKGVFKTTVWIPENLLNVESYSIAISLSTISPLKVHFWVKDALIFDTTEDLKNRTDSYNLELPGVIRPLLRWETKA